MEGKIIVRINQLKSSVRFKLKILSLLLLLQIIPVIQLNIVNSFNYNPTFNTPILIDEQSNLIEYTFDSIGLSLEEFQWSSLGTFSISYNKSFDLDNRGPAILLLDYSSDGDKPASPGYKIYGTFNGANYSMFISRAILSSDSSEVKQIVIPLESEGRIFGNNINFSISAENSIEAEAAGSLQILGSSKLLIGDVLQIDTFGYYQVQLFPTKWEGLSSMSGTNIRTIVQFTILNETLISQGNCDLKLKYKLTGEVTNTIYLFDQNQDAFQTTKVVLDDGSINASSAIEPILGINTFTIEMTIYSKNLWVTDFNLTFAFCYLEFEPAGQGFGFDNLVIPFFNWPDHPVVGVLLLFVWILPYSILKYRDWKKLPNEVELNNLDNEDPNNIFDPEGLATGDDHGDFDEPIPTVED